MALDRPDAAELLAIGREVLLAELLPALPQGQKYNALMLANALAIAGRELADGERAETQEARRLRAFLDRADPATAPDPDAGRQLARALREGGLDDRDADLRRLLREQTLRRLRLSNPKYLKSYNLE